MCSGLVVAIRHQSKRLAVDGWIVVFFVVGFARQLADEPIHDGVVAANRYEAVASIQRQKSTCGHPSPPVGRLLVYPVWGEIGKKA